jgi:hypothetical protein
MRTATGICVESVSGRRHRPLRMGAILAFAAMTVGPTVIRQSKSAAASSIRKPLADDRERMRFEISALDVRAAAVDPQPSADSMAAARPQPPNARAAASPLDPAKELTVLREQHRSALAQHAREPADPPWATEMSSVIGRGLAAIAFDGEFKVLGVDCRSRTCVASVDWESASTAYSRWPAVVRGSYGRCGVEVVLDEPAAAKTRFGTKILFPCR